MFHLLSRWIIVFETCCKRIKVSSRKIKRYHILYIMHNPWTYSSVLCITQKYLGTYSIYRPTYTSIQYTIETNVCPCTHNIYTDARTCTYNYLFRVHNLLCAYIHVHICMYTNMLPYAFTGEI